MRIGALYWLGLNPSFVLETKLKITVPQRASYIWAMNTSAHPMQVCKPSNYKQVVR